jgi:membrane-bound lytic murein transglycosylase D
MSAGSLATLVAVLRYLMAAGALLALGSLIARALAAWLPARASWCLALSRVLLVLSLVLPAVASRLPRERLFSPGATLEVERGEAAAPAAARFRVATELPAAGPRDPGVAVDPRALASGLALLVSIALALLLRRALEAARLRTWVRSQPLLRRIGRVSVRATSGLAQVPLAVRIPGEASVVLPLALLDSPGESLLAIRHELQHHRQGDTLWTYAFEALRAAFFWNPAMRLWASSMDRLQEYACDEALIGRRSIQPQAYGRCLLRAAELALGAPPLRYGAGMGTSGAFLRRRIEMLFETRRIGAARSALFAGISIGAASLMALAAFAAQSSVQDRSFTLDEIREKVGAQAETAAIPIVLNELVLRELNRYLGSEPGREQFRRSMANMAAQRPGIEERLSAAGLPRDLAIVPFVETGYTNYFNPRRPKGGVGYWAFIQSTARRYDLKVDKPGDESGGDERLDLEKETGAAIRYFKDLHALFGDWKLALKGYNEGEGRVTKLIRKHGTRDAWELEKKEESKERYLARITASLIILRNPALLE